MPDLQHCESPLVQVDLSQFDKVKGVEIRELAFQGHLNLRGRQSDSEFCAAVLDITGVELPLNANTFVTSGNLKIYWLGPEEWLIVIQPEQRIELKSSLQQGLQGIFSLVTDVSSGQTIISICGINARALIEKGCTVDLHPRQFKKGACAQTHLAKAAILISVIEDGMEFEIIVRRSFADYLGLWLLDSTVEFIE